MNDTKTAQVRYEGQQVSLPEDIANDDGKLRAALVVAWPSISTAEISRSREDGVLVVSCAKKAGSKGGTEDVAARLAAAPEKLNPALQLAGELRLAEAREQLTPIMLFHQKDRIEKAMKEGEIDLHRVREVVARLVEMTAQASRTVPAGF